jgi:hypothetical protein
MDIRFGTWDVKNLMGQAIGNFCKKKLELADDLTFF